ncbi:unnamed protein product [Caenorhabditis bovis]|uniref:Hyaluronidase n=1 Tax=Caenorhabditis bovis TaxID=2654633 RepID=A0A8S1ELM5_9PELO|nr:unnamed protein product [Caenorhabditis bovis]
MQLLSNNQVEPRPINGGLPQLGNLKRHLRRAEDDINRIVPNKDFDGIAVIDIESFRPTWQLSWGKFEIYKHESMKLVRAEYPDWPEQLVAKKAKEDYETACKLFFVESLRLAKRLRPNAKWGFYLFPKCNGDVGQKNSTECELNFRKYNDQLKWLWLESSALFPSIYLYPQHKNIPKQNFITNAPNLYASTGVGMEMRVENIVIWSSSARMNERCDSLKRYVDNTLGPFVRFIRIKMRNCRKYECSSVGECLFSLKQQSINIEHEDSENENSEYDNHLAIIDASRAQRTKLIDLDAHLEITANDIITKIPDENFNGIAIFDIEEFRPMWLLSWGNFQVYKRESIKLVAEKYPWWTQKMIEKLAQQEYDEACKTIFLETLRLGKRLRPNAKWGFYLFPKCNDDVGENSQRDCSKLFQAYNDDLYWLWKETTALFPSIYIYNKHREASWYNFIRNTALLKETERVRNVYSPNSEIHVFSKIEYDPYGRNFADFYSKEDLLASLETAMRLNVDSVVLWSTSTNMRHRCEFIREFVDETLGPFIRIANRKLDKCRVERCSTHGECYMEYSEMYPSHHHFFCRCDSPYSGKYCEYLNQFQQEESSYDSPSQWFMNN